MSANSIEQTLPAYSDEYDPFTRGRFPAGVRTLEARDAARNRTFPCEVWYPADAKYTGQDLEPATRDVFTDSPGGDLRSQEAVRDAAAQAGTYPLIVFSHSSGGRRRQSSFLCTHLASHGYVAAALNHSETIAPELGRQEGESEAQKWARVDQWIANRVPDIRFLLDTLLDSGVWASEAQPAPERIGIVGHSFGGWTALAAPEVDDRIRAVVALAPGGSSNPPPNIIPAKLTFQWGRDVPTLYLVAEDDQVLPLSGMVELYERTQSTRQMVTLRHADHMHFADEFEAQPGMCTREQAHRVVRGLTLCHLDATLKGLPAAQQFLAGNLAGELMLLVHAKVR